VIRVAAVGDVHVGVDSVGTLRPALTQLRDCADVLLLAGDLTRLGREEELRVLLDELDGIGVPCVAVLGNHDYESDQAETLTKLLVDADVTVLEGTNVVIDTGEFRLGIAGSKGFGGGFAGACASDFGESEMKAFLQPTKQMAAAVGAALDDLDRHGVDARVALLHFAPVKDTLGAERLEIFPFLGSYLLGEAIDRAGADLVIHGHAHHGVEHGVTPSGIPVRNVALPVIREAFRVYCLGTEPETEKH
jgi:Icc-related predicted phosphoesterase